MGYGTLLRSTGLYAEAEATIVGSSPKSKTESCAGWTVGFAQLALSQAFTLTYRGRNKTDGSLFYDLGPGTGRPDPGVRDLFGSALYTLGLAKDGQSCLDTTGYGSAAQFWYDKRMAGAPAPPVCPAKVELKGKVKPVGTATTSAGLLDKPQNFLPGLKKHPANGKTMYLAEVYREVVFCAALFGQDPVGALTPLGFFLWGVRWEYKYKPNDYMDPAKGWSVTPGSSYTRVTEALTPGLLIDTFGAASGGTDWAIAEKILNALFVAPAGGKNCNDLAKDKDPLTAAPTSTSTERDHAF
jgi:hypothetical protein